MILSNSMGRLQQNSDFQKQEREEVDQMNLVFVMEKKKRMQAQTRQYLSKSWGRVFEVTPLAEGLLVMNSCRDGEGILIKGVDPCR